MFILMVCVAVISSFAKVFVGNLKIQGPRFHQGGLVYAKLREIYSRCA
jgi:hypothetical protein